MVLFRQPVPREAGGDTGCVRRDGQDGQDTHGIAGPGVTAVLLGPVPALTGAQTWPGRAACAGPG